MITTAEKADAFRKLHEGPGVLVSIERLVHGIDAPVNLLAGPRTPSIAAMERLGVRRVSIGSSLVRAVYGLVQSSLEELRERGTFTFSETGISYPELNAMLAGPAVETIPRPASPDGALSSSSDRSRELVSRLRAQ